MDEAVFDSFCRALPGVTFEVLWGADRCYKVGGKLFCVLGPDGHLAFKASDIAFEMLTELGVARPAPYAARAKWVQIASLEAMPTAELQDYLQAAHALIAARLPRKARREIRCE